LSEPDPAPDKERYGAQEKTYKCEIEDEYVEHVLTYATECWLSLAYYPWLPSGSGH